MKCAIMQPTYLPWSGYFNLIASVDRFVFLDNVQLERQSWQTRNRILLQGREHLLVVPVERAPLTTPINQILLSEQRGNWRREHWRTLEAAYAKAPYGRQALDLLEPFYASASETLLARLNQSVIRAIAAALELDTVFHLASEMDCAGERTSRLVGLCEALACDTYRSPPGSADYLQADGFTRATDVKLEFQSFTPAPYPQFRGTGFVSHLSVVDVIANTGLDHTKAYISEQAAC